MDGIITVTAKSENTSNNPRSGTIEVSGSGINRSISINQTTAVDEQNHETLPSVYHLEQNYPNPFNPSTKINFALPRTGEVTLAIYNETGQLVSELVNHAMSAGRHEVIWDGRNESGAQVAAGVYLYKLIVANSHSEVVFTDTKRMTLLK